MSGPIEYDTDTVAPCTTIGCAGTLHSDRRYVYFRCPVCDETSVRLGIRFLRNGPEHSVPRAIVIEKDKP